MAGSEAMISPHMPNAGGWHITFDDEFNTFAPYTGFAGTWQTGYWWGRTNPGTREIEYYADHSPGTGPFAVHDGALHIAAAPSAGNELGLPYVSGIITTFPTFSQRFGFFEMRAQLPAGKAMWPAFWLAATDKSWPPELDVMEALGQTPHEYSMNTHSGAGGRDLHQTPHRATVIPDLTAGFHIYGVDWEGDRVTWYFDGKAMATSVTPPDLNKPMYVIANLAVAGDPRYGPPDHDTHFPAELKINYIRVFARDGAATISPPATNHAHAGIGGSNPEHTASHHAALLPAVPLALAAASCLLMIRASHSYLQRRPRSPRG